RGDPERDASPRARHGLPSSWTSARVRSHRRPRRAAPAGDAARAGPWVGAPAAPAPGGLARLVAWVGAYNLGDDEVRAALGLVVHPAEVLADQPEKEQLDTGEEGDRNDERGKPLRARAEEEALEDRPQRVDRCREGSHRSEDPGGAKGRHRKGEDAV